MGNGRRTARDLDGILLLDKPVGMGSNEALQVVKRIFNARKAGHTGSLDRLASGLLPICMGEATKLSGFLLNADKRYRATFKLGVVTSTGDAEGDVLRRVEPPAYTTDEIRSTLDAFRGEIEQVPPMHSAIKHKGQRLYKLAHQGLVVERAPRPVCIHELTLIAQGRDSLSLEIHCTKGTYIRTLAEDIGEALGCGASISCLYRIGSGPFVAEQMHTLDELRARAERGVNVLDELLLPMDSAVNDLPRVCLSDDVAFYLRQGQPVMVPHAPTEGWVKLFGRDQDFIGIGEVLDDGRIAPRRLLRRVQ